MRKRLVGWWHHEDVDFQNRAYVFTFEYLLAGEHGWKTRVNEVNGFVCSGDFLRDDVKEISVYPRDAARRRGPENLARSNGPAHTAGNSE